MNAALRQAKEKQMATIDRATLGMVDVHVFAQVYNFCFDDGRIYTPTESEKAMLEDAINGYIAECEQRQAEANDGLTQHEIDREESLDSIGWYGEAY